MIDSSTWVVGGSDRPVAVETNTASRPANQRRGRAPGIHLTHAEDFLRTKTHINTHTHTHTYTDTLILHVLYFSVEYTSVCVLKFICAHVRMHVCVEFMCVFSPCGVVVCRHSLWVVDVVVMGECSLDLCAHTHTYTHTHTHTHTHNLTQTHTHMHTHRHTQTHTHRGGQGSACIKRPNKRSFPHRKPTADKTSRQKSKNATGRKCVYVWRWRGFRGS